MSTSADSISTASDKPQTPARQLGRLLFGGCALGAAYLLIWFIRHSYSSFSDDAQLYAFQALARINPEFAANDVFLRYGSQDDYTLFTPLFAWCIGLFGLPGAQALLTFLFHVWSAIAAWFIARRLTSNEGAWLAVGGVLVVPGLYGGLGVFGYAEGFLTARLPAEALVLTSIALFIHGRSAWSCVALLAALLIHPLMSAPCVILLALLAVPAWCRKFAWIIGGTGLALLVVIAVLVPFGLLAPMDHEWFSIVRRRSNYMFLDEWRVGDWNWVLLSFFTLGLVGMISTDAAARRFVYVTACVGALGIALAGVTTFILPIEILVQGQPWRWTWLSTLIAILLLAPTLLHCVRTRDTTGVASCILAMSAWVLATGWAFSSFTAAGIMLLAISIYAARGKLPLEYLRYAYILSAAVAALALVSATTFAFPVLQLTFASGMEPAALEIARNLFDLTVPAAAAVALAWSCTLRGKNTVATALTFMAAATALAAVIPGAYGRWTTSEYLASYPEFQQWREAVDHRRNVLWLQNPLAVWLLLESPSYLSVSQAAGVAFSRETAIEITRRAKSLEPWAGHAGLAIDKSLRKHLQPLTLDALAHICADPSLGYIVSQDEVPVAHLLHDAANWRGWRLYSCDTVLAGPIVNSPKSSTLRQDVL